MNKTATAQPDKTVSFLPSNRGILQRKCACGNHTIAGGECTDCAKKKMGLQRKLTIGVSNDPLEQEADRISDQVMASLGHGTVSDAPIRIQRFTGSSSGQTAEAPASVERVLASPGQPLETGLREEMEGRFGYDFSRVRIHTGGAAEQSARDVNANAYTVRNSVVFGVGRFTPETHKGRRLIAHELAHVAQQTGPSLLYREEYIHYIIMPRARVDTQSLRAYLDVAIPRETRTGMAMHLFHFLPALAEILDEYLNETNIHEIVNPISVSHPSSYDDRSFPISARNALWDYYKARWESPNRAVRRRWIESGMRNAAPYLRPAVLRRYTGRYYEQINNLVQSLIRNRSRALYQSGPYIVLSHRERVVEHLNHDGTEVAELTATPDAPQRVRIPERTSEEHETDQVFETQAHAMIERRQPTEASRTEYASIDEANSETESGRRYLASGRGTSSGQPASLGRGQLLVQLQVERTLRYLNGGGSLAQQITERSGLTLANMREIDHLGKAALRWYDDVTGSSSAASPYTHQIRQLLLQGSTDDIVTQFGSLFQAETGGLSANELRNMASFHGIRSGEYKAEYRALLRSVHNDLTLLRNTHQLHYNELQRGESRMSARQATLTLLDELEQSDDLVILSSGNAVLFAAIRAREGMTFANARNPQHVRAIVMNLFRERHPEMITLLEAHPGDRNQMTENSLHLYLTTNTNAEDRNGWYSRGAMQSEHWVAYERLLPSLDIYTTQDRSLDNYERAIAIARRFSGFEALTGHTRAIFLGQMARMNHGGSGRFNAMYTGSSRSARSLRVFQPMVVPYSVADVRMLYRQIWAVTASDLCAKIRQSLSNWTNNYLSTQHVMASDVDIIIPTLSAAALADSSEPATIPVTDVDTNDSSHGTD
jgi:hypothetical protein